MDAKIIDGVLGTPGLAEQYLTEGVDVDAITDRRGLIKKKTIVLTDVPDTAGDQAGPDPNATPEGRPKPPNPADDWGDLEPGSGD